MTSIYVDVDIENYLDEVAVRDLVEELKRRGKSIVSEVPVITDRRLAQELRGAYYKRDASRFEALLIAHLDPIEIKKEKVEA